MDQTKMKCIVLIITKDDFTRKIQKIVKFECLCIKILHNKV